MTTQKRQRTSGKIWDYKTDNCVGFICNPISPLFVSYTFGWCCLPVSPSDNHNNFIVKQFHDLMFEGFLASSITVAYAVAADARPYEQWHYPLGHNHLSRDIWKPTCTTNALQMGLYCSTLGKSHQRNNDIKKEYVLYLQYLMIQVYNVLFGYGTRIAWSADIVDSLLSQCCDVWLLDT